MKVNLAGFFEWFERLIFALGVNLTPGSLNATFGTELETLRKINESAQEKRAAKNMLESEKNLRLAEKSDFSRKLTPHH